MKKRCKLLCLLLCATLLPLGISCAEDPLVSSPDTAIVFTDSAGYNVSLNRTGFRMDSARLSIAERSCPYCHRQLTALDIRNRRCGNEK